MYDRKLKKAVVLNLSPREAWEHYVTLTPERFISDFYYNAPPVYDLKDMCRIFALEIPNEALYTNKQLDKIESLIYSYLTSYIEKAGGLDQLDLYSEEELDRIDRIEMEQFMKIIDDYCKRYR